jgi:hypothetical protein
MTACPIAAVNDSADQKRVDTKARPDILPGYAP